MELLDQYFEIQKAIHDFFGYVENWKVIPLDDGREYFWRIDQNEDGSGTVCFADSEEELANETGNYYENEIYTQRHLDRWVFRAEGFTMVSVDTHTDGNKFLQVFDNTKERADVQSDTNTKENNNE